MDSRWPALALDAEPWPAPGRGEAIVVAVDLRDIGWRDDPARDAMEPPAVTLLRPLLDAEERARETRFVHPRDRVRHVVSHAVLRQVLARHLGWGVEEPASRLLAEVRHAHAEDGKPSLAGASGVTLPFNLSHAGPWVLIAATRAGPVGVDVEVHGPLPDLDALAATHFAAAEREALARLPALARPEAFFRIWSRKEAFVKALGTGLSTPLQGFEVSAEPDDAEALRRIGDSASAVAAWTLRDLPGLAGASAALAVRAPGVAVRGYRLALTTVSRSRQKPL